MIPSLLPDEQFPVATITANRFAIFAPFVTFASNQLSTRIAGTASVGVVCKRGVPAVTMVT
jgi:hypothetical protein